MGVWVCVFVSVCVCVCVCVCVHVCACVCVVCVRERFVPVCASEGSVAAVLVRVTALEVAPRLSCDARRPRCMGVRGLRERRRGRRGLRRAAVAAARRAAGSEPHAEPE